VNNTIIRLRKNGKTVHEISQLLGIDKIRVNKELNDYIVQEYKNGRSAPDIAEEIGLTANSIYDRLRAAKIEIRNLRIELDMKSIIREYNNGKDIGEIAKELGAEP